MRFVRDAAAASTTTGDEIAEPLSLDCRTPLRPRLGNVSERVGPRFDSPTPAIQTRPSCPSCPSCRAVHISGHWPAVREDPGWNAVV